MPSRIVCVTLLACVIAGGRLSAADGPPQFHRPVTKVVTTQGEMGVLSPQGEFPGSVYFKAVSEVATEIRGKVVEVTFEVGERVTKGETLVRLDDELLRKDLSAARARLARDKTLLQSAETRLTRAEGLVAGGLSPTEELDDTRFAVQGLRFSLSATEAELARLEAIIRKSEIASPFDGVVLTRPVEIGEWRTEGSTIATIAREDLYEAVVDVPEASVGFLKPGQEIELQIGPERVKGTVAAVVPRGDIVSRTFPVKLDIATEAPLMEGMTARARMPIAASVECLLLPRDAILNQLGSNFVFTVLDGVAHKHPVEIIGYDGMKVGVHAPDIGPGQLFITSGHDRLIEGDTVEIVSGLSALPPAR